jgi:type II secretory pathway predicted ATPase ExeA
MYLRLSPYQEVLQGVITSLQVNEGIIKITGKSGSGKTALCSQLFHELEANTQPSVFFLKPPASAVALQNDILDNLRLDPTGNFTRTLTAYLLAKTTQQKPLVLIFDDAQQLDPQTFSAIRMLCNIQDGARAMVRVILCGNEELDEKLAKPALRAVTQFLNQSFTLPYLSQEQVNDFCQGYWMLMGEEMKPMSESVQKKLFQETQGHPGILQARLNQGTTGAEKSDRHGRDDEPGTIQSRPYRYSGQRKGWAPALLIVAGLIVLGGAGVYLFLIPSLVDDTVVPASATVATRSAPESVASPAEAETIQAAQIPSPVVAVAEEPVAAPPEETVAGATQEPPVDVEAASPATMVAAPANEIVATEAPAVAEAAPEQAPETVTPQAAEQIATEPQETPAPPAETASALPAVEDFIAAWTTSWESKDVDAYLAAYHPEFTPPQGATREAWEEQRRRVITNAVDITVSADAPESVREAQDGMRLVRFWLNYSAANYADRTLKELLLAPVDGAWRIRIETNLRTERQ